MDENKDEKKEESSFAEAPEDKEETPIIPSGPDPDDESESSMPMDSYAPPKKRNWKKLIYLLGLIILILVVFNVVKTLTKGSSAKPTPSPTSTPVAKESPSPASTPTPSPSSVDTETGLDRSNLSVEVQNGSGTAGVAVKAKNFLKNLGYNVTSVGNADNFNYTDVTVKVKAADKKYLPLLIKDLSGSYTVGSSSSDLSASSSADALVIVGK